MMQTSLNGRMKAQGHGVAQEGVGSELLRSRFL
jgi:hypothetical protein